MALCVAIGIGVSAFVITVCVKYLPGWIEAMPEGSTVASVGDEDITDLSNGGIGDHALEMCFLYGLDRAHDHGEHTENKENNRKFI